MYKVAVESPEAKSAVAFDKNTAVFLTVAGAFKVAEPEPLARYPLAATPFNVAAAIEAEAGDPHHVQCYHTELGLHHQQYIVKYRKLYPKECYQ